MRETFFLTFHREGLTPKTLFIILFLMSRLAAFQNNLIVIADDISLDIFLVFS